MSRYVRLDAAPRQVERDDLTRALVALGLAPRVGEIPGALMLAGSFECAGEPVDLAVDAEVLGAIAEVGLRRTPEGWQLVCGEHDRALLRDRLLGPLQRELAAARVRAAAAAAGLDLEVLPREGEQLRLRVRPRE